MNFNLNEFFYNIIPGVFFFAFWYAKNLRIHSLVDSMRTISGDNVTVGVVLLVLALGLGMFLHGFFRSVKYLIKTLIGQFNKPWLEEMYNNKALVWVNGCRNLPGFFSDRSAIWCTMFTGILFSFFLVPKYKSYYVVGIIVFIAMYTIDYIKDNDSSRRIANIIRSRSDK